MSDRTPLREVVLLLALIVALLAVLAGFVAFRPDGLTDQWASLFVVAVLLLVPAMRAACLGRFDPLEPLFLVNTAFFLYCVYAPADDLFHGREYFFGVHVTPLIPKGFAILSAGFVAMYVGYYSRAGAAFAARSPKPTEAHRGAIAVAVAIALVAIAAFGSWVRLSGMSWIRLLTFGQMGVSAEAVVELAGDAPMGNYLYGTLDWFTGAFMIAFAFLRKHRWTLIVAFALILAIYTTIGFRFRVMILGLAPLIYYYMSVRRRPSIPLLMTAGAAAALIIGGIGSVRTKMRMAAAVEVDEITMQRAQESFVRDLDIYQPYLALTDRMPDPQDFLWGQSFAYLLVHPIPRAIWEDKPEPPVHVIIRRAFGGKDAVQAGVAYPNVGEYYANFGVMGVVLCMMLFGLAMRWFWEYARRYDDNPWVRCLYGIGLPFLVVVVSRGYLVFAVQSASFFFGPVLVGMWVARRRERARARRARRALRLASSAPGAD